MNMPYRYVDLLKQGFMKPKKPRRKAVPKPQAPIVACERCMDWHRKGQHHSKKFLAERRAREDARNLARKASE